MDLEHILLLFMIAICVAGLAAARLRVAPPITFLLLGCAIALIPDMPTISIKPEYMLLIFLPPILMEAAFFTSIREFKANLRPILQLALGLVVVTSIAVAMVVMAIIPDATWALGLVLGAIVSPPDAAAATFALKGVKVPRRITSILEGESLINDATGLVLFKFTLATVVTAEFSPTTASIEFIWLAVMGTIIGFLSGFAFVKLYPHIRDLNIEIISTFIPPYAAYIIAENFHASGVLAVVTAGLYVGWHGPSLFGPNFRIPAEAIWKMVVFALNAIVFLLIGLQFPDLLARLSDYKPLYLLVSALAVCFTVAGVRFVWVYLLAYGTRFLIPSIRERDPYPSWQNVFVIAWTGMRGVVTLATALALPLTLSQDVLFPHRDLLIFLAVCVIVFTIIIQGATLPFILRRLTLKYEERFISEEWHTRYAMTQKALSHLDEMMTDPTVHLPALERIRAHYSERLQSLGDGPNTPLYATDIPSAANHPLIQAENRIWHEVLREERKLLIALRRNFKVGDDTMHEMLREMDLLARRFHYETITTPPTIHAQQSMITRTRALFSSTKEQSPTA